jgi:hypothetical protein
VKLSVPVNVVAKAFTVTTTVPLRVSVQEPYMGILIAFTDKVVLVVKD